MVHGIGICLLYHNTVCSTVVPWCIVLGDSICVCRFYRQNDINCIPHAVLWGGEVPYGNTAVLMLYGEMLIAILFERKFVIGVKL